MFKHSTLDIVGHANIENSKARVAQEVDAVCLHRVKLTQQRTAIRRDNEVIWKTEEFASGFHLH